MEYDDLLTEKDEEIARLKRHLDRLPMECSERSALHKDRGEPPPERLRFVVVRSPTVEPSHGHQPETVSDRRTQGDTRERPADESRLGRCGTPTDTPASEGTVATPTRQGKAPPSGVRTRMSHLRIGCQLCSASLHGMAGAMRRNYYSWRDTCAGFFKNSNERHSTSLWAHSGLPGVEHLLHKTFATQLNEIRNLSVDWSRHFNWPMACSQRHETCYSIVSYRRVSATT